MNTRACDHIITCTRCTPVEIRYCINNDCILPLRSFYDITEVEFNRTSKVLEYDAEFLMFIKIVPVTEGISMNFYQSKNLQVHSDFLFDSLILCIIRF